MTIIEIVGKPLPLQRARAGKKGFYDPQFLAKRNFAYLVKEQFKDEPIDKAISLTLEFSIAMPKSWSQKKKYKMRYTEHIQTPDTSNLIKFVEDALNSIVWKDDCLIYQINSDKLWDDEGKTVMKIYY